MKTETIEAISNGGAKIMVAGGGVSAFSIWLASNILGLVGVFVALIGLWVNIHYKRKADKRHEQAHQILTRRTEVSIEATRLRMEIMRTTGIPVPDTPESDFGTLEPSKAVED